MRELLASKKEVLGFLLVCMYVGTNSHFIKFVWSSDGSSVSHVPFADVTTDVGAASRFERCDHCSYATLEYKLVSLKGESQ